MNEELEPDPDDPELERAKRELLEELDRIDQEEADSQLSLEALPPEPVPEHDGLFSKSLIVPNLMILVMVAFWLAVVMLPAFYLGHWWASGQPAPTSVDAPIRDGIPPPPVPNVESLPAIAGIDNLVAVGCALLMLFMLAGLSLIQSGKNLAWQATIILYENFTVVMVGILAFYLVGFGLMYPALHLAPEVAGNINPYIAFGGIGVHNGGEVASGVNPQAAWLLNAIRAAVVCVIALGAVAGRIKFATCAVVPFVLAGVFYPICGYWIWGGGWLAQFGVPEVEGGWSMAFQDFAGSATVHVVGGFGALAAAMIVGPRWGRFFQGRSMPIAGHDVNYVAWGVFLLWVGWFGFSAANLTTPDKAYDTTTLPLVVSNVSLAAAAGAVTSILVSWGLFGKPDMLMSFDGILGGLVSISASCAAVSHGMAILIGSVAGVLVIAGVLLLDKWRIDDPAGAWPVHGLCGVWGCLVVGILPNDYLHAGATSFLIQVVGVVAVAVWSFLGMGLVFIVLMKVGLMRATPWGDEESLATSAYEGETVLGATAAQPSTE